ncbi:MAG: DUF2851 family protein [Dehalococcoidia bacterium]|nr:DUF2851 family protein [Dehalococcoidia bacterium]MDW8119642.1 DUF2851 family protein [Chloroflexota bacterium]
MAKQKGYPVIAEREENLWRAWATTAPEWGFLPASDGHRYRILYPGRLNRGAGPDFQDALLLRGDGRLLRGDVEVHCSPDAWASHGHHADPRYRQVLLHLVLGKSPSPRPSPPQVDLPDGALLQVGKVAPPFVGACPTLATLHRWADARFRQRASGYARLIVSVGVEEALYRGLMEGMGYGANREPMRQLAEGMPYRVLRRVALPCTPQERATRLAAVLLGSAGLLSGGDPLVRLWRETPWQPVLSPEAWCRAGVRPANRPARRLWGMAVLVARWWDEGLPQALRRGAVNGPSALERVLTVPSPTGGPALIGRSRAREVAVSVVLPFLWAWATAQGNPSLRRAVWACWKVFPPPAENAVSRAMRALLPMPIPSTARAQQGLLAWARRLGAPWALTPS